jgi:hypothetical protein
MWKKLCSSYQVKLDYQTGRTISAQNVEINALVLCLREAI